MKQQKLIYSLILMMVALAGQIRAQDAAKEFVPHRDFVQRTATADTAKLLARPETRAKDVGALEEMRQHILTMYRGVEVNHSFALRGQHVDCVPMDQQPSVRLLGLKVASTPPDSLLPSVPARARALHTGSAQLGPEEQFDQFGNSTRCEDNTIPMRRVTLEEMSRFENLQQFFSKHRGASSRSTVSDKPQAFGAFDHEYAYTYQYVKNLGGFSIMTLANPWVDTSLGQSMSLSQQWYVGGSGNAAQTVEAGWQVAPNKQIAPPANTTLEGEQPFLFIYWTADNYQTTGCYNLECPAFVQKNPNFYLGYGFSAGTEVQIAYQLINGAWWLAVNGQWVGYYPVGIFRGGQMASYATLIEFGGETANVLASTSWPPMGSGSWGTDGYSGGAAYQRWIYYYAPGIPNWKTGAPSTISRWANLTAFQPSPLCYTTGGPKFANDGVWGEYFFFGGPGGNGSCH